MWASLSSFQRTSHYMRSAPYLSGFACFSWGLCSPFGRNCYFPPMAEMQIIPSNLHGLIECCHTALTQSNSFSYLRKLGKVGWTTDITMLSVLGGFRLRRLLNPDPGTWDGLYNNRSLSFVRNYLHSKRREVLESPIVFPPGTFSKNLVLSKSQKHLGK